MLKLKVEIIINRPRERVWDFFTTSRNWKRWWGADLKKVEPGWEEGAIITWGNDTTSSIIELIPQEMIRIGNNLISNIWQFKVFDKEKTLVEWEVISPIARFSDGGVAYRIELEATLKKLKQCIEELPLKKVSVKKKWWQFWK